VEGRRDPIGFGIVLPPMFALQGPAEDCTCETCEPLTTEGGLIRTIPLSEDPDAPRFIIDLTSP
jgi:hypothetical protein